MKSLSSKIVGITAVCSAVAMATGCTHTLSHGITDAGNVEASNLVFPDLDSAWEKTVSSLILRICQRLNLG